MLNLDKMMGKIGFSWLLLRFNISQTRCKIGTICAHCDINVDQNKSDVGPK